MYCRHLSHFARSWYRITLLRQLAGCWSMNSTNSHPGPFNRRVLRSCLVPQCSHPPHWPCHLRHLANCDWMPVSYTNGKPSNPCRHPTNWALLQWSHTVSRTPCHRAWTYAPLSLYLSIECKRTVPQIMTLICTCHTTSHQFICQQQHMCGTVGDHQWNAEWTDNHTRLRIFMADTGTRNDHPARRAWVRLNRLRTGVGHFRSCLYKWGMTTSAACECGAEELLTLTSSYATDYWLSTFSKKKFIKNKFHIFMTAKDLHHYLLLITSLEKTLGNGQVAKNVIVPISRTVVNADKVCWYLYPCTGFCISMCRLAQKFKDHLPKIWSFTTSLENCLICFVTLLFKL